MPSVVEVRSNCRSCLAGCGVLVEVEDGERVVGVRGDRDNPRTKGYLCPKGPQLLWGHNRPDRLNQPSLAGRPAGWDETLDDLARRIEGAVARNGPDGFGYYAGSGCDPLGVQALRRFADALGTAQSYTPLTMDIAPSLKAAELVTGYPGALMPHWELEDEDTRLLIYVGCNPVISHGYVGSAGMAAPVRTFRAFKARGGKIWVIDPVRTRSAALADEHLAPIPGTDPVILAWLVRQVLESLPADAAARTTTKAADRERLRQGLEIFDLQTVVAITGVEAGRLEQLAADIKAAKRIAMPGGTGMSFGPHGLMGEWLRWALLILTDSLEQPGGMWFDPGWQTPLEKLPSWSPAPEEGGTADAPATRPDLKRLFGQTPLAALADEIEDGPLRALLVFGASPLTAVPDPRRMRRALQSLDALAVIDVVPTPLTAIASHVLAASGQLERTEISGLLAQPFRPRLSPAVVAPAAERRHSWWIIAQLAKRLGVLGQVLDGADPDRTSEEDLIRPNLANARHTYEEMVAAGPHGVDYPRRFRWALERAVPDGKWRVAPEVLVRRLPSLLAAETTDDFPLLMTCGRQDRRHNCHENVNRDRDREIPALRLAPQDAEAYRIVDGGYATVRSAHGAVTVQAVVDPQIRPGAVTLPHGWHEANACVLNDSRKVDPLTTQPQMTAIPVAIAPAAAAAAHERNEIERSL